MNFHVIAVHFPIALLTVYSLLELIRWQKITALPYWFYLKAFFVILGTLGAIAAALLGELFVLSQGIHLKGAVLTHALFAILTIVIFAGISKLYLFAWLDRGLGQSSGQAGLERHPHLQKLGRVTTHPVMVLFALIGLLAVTTTGALGGIMAFGPDTDPFTRLIYDLLVAQ